MQNGKTKVLFVITKSVWGGAGKYVYDLTINLPKKDFEIAVAAGGQGLLAQKLRDVGAVYYDIKNFQRDVKIVNDILAFFEILNLIRKVKPDILHASSSKAGGIAGVAALIYKIITKFQVPSSKFQVFFTAHGWAFNELRPKWQIVLIKFFSRLTVLFYDRIICVSEFDRQSAIKNKIAPAKKLITIHNGIDAGEYQFLAKEEAKKKLKNKNLELGTWNLELGKYFLIGTIGEFTKNKGQAYLIDAVSQLKAKSYELKSVIIGWGEEKKNLEYRIENLGLGDKIFLIENLTPASPYLKAFDIFVLPSTKEGLPYTLLEAGLAELPVIATNVGGNPEIIEHKKTGLLISPANSDEIADAVQFLIKNPETAENLASNLHKKILQEFSLEKMVKETLEVYNL